MCGGQRRHGDGDRLRIRLVPAAPHSRDVEGPAVDHPTPIGLGGERAERRALRQRDRLRVAGAQDVTGPSGAEASTLIAPTMTNDEAAAELSGAACCPRAWDF